MKAVEVLILIAYAFGMAAGQLMFKAAARNSAGGDVHGFVLGLLGNFWFLAAALFYAALTVLWVWILTLVPLSRAYPFVVLSFVLTPLGATLFFGERLDASYYAGMACILVGLGILVLKGG